MENVEKVINGKLYSTAYATVIARGSLLNLAVTCKIALYKTTKGSYFKLLYEIKADYFYPAGWVTEDEPPKITPCTKEEAKEFFYENDQLVSYFEAFDEELEVA